jgi:tetratricopeptide (TPR) repeat protein
MKKQLLALILFFTFNPLFSQTSLKEVALANGQYNVGFRHFTAHDSSRTYNRVLDYTKKRIPRPVPISIWYPSSQSVNGMHPLLVKDYIRILAEEEEWEYLPDYYLLDWFQGLQNTPENQKHFLEQTLAFKDLSQGKGRFPAIIYSPGNQASSIENFALCEFLASHGYIVISSPSRGTENRFLTGQAAKDLETQARDIEFLIEKATQLPGVNHEKIASMGFSFGGMANVLSQMRDDRIKAVVSLDGTVKYAYQTLQSSPFFSIENANVPFIHMAQKDIPEEVLKEENVAASLNSEFAFFEKLSQRDAFQIQSQHLTHSYFSTLGLLFGTRDPRQDHADSLIMESYALVASYTLNFLNGYLLNQDVAQEFMKSSPEENGIPKGFLTIKRNQIIQKSEFDFSDFNDLARKNGYTSITEKYDSLKSIHPILALPEGNLNYLGLQLLYNRETTGESILIFEFATSLYPSSANLFDSLGEAYLYKGDTANAILNYRKSLDLNPENENAVLQLKKLEASIK